MEEMPQNKINIKICTFCGASINRDKKLSQKQWERKRFCSHECQWKGSDRTKQGGHNKGIKRAIPKKCDVCSSYRKVCFYRAFQKLLCDKHYFHLKNHGRVLWIDERPYKTPKKKRERGLLEMINWRRAVFERDNYTCQICKERGGKLEADHIKPYEYFPELRLSLKNGRTLCKECHMKTPTWGRRGQKIYGKK